MIFLLRVMNIEGVSPCNFVRLEPLFLGRREPIWLVLELEQGVITRVRLSMERPEGQESRPRYAKLFEDILLGKDLQETGIDFQIQGTAFQKRLWAETCRIPSGSLISYKELASRISCRSARAVGQALRKNPLPIIIPCHRVIGSDGKLTGFSCGLEIKKILIEFERQTGGSRYEDRNIQRQP